MCFFILVAGIIFLQAGCSTTAKRLDEDVVRQQVIGNKTQTEIRKFFGRPWIEESIEGGRKLDVYNYIFPRAQIVATNQRAIEVRTLSMIYGPDDRLQQHHYYVTESRTFAGLGNEWRNGSPLDSAKLKKIKAGVTTKDEVVKLFGPATFEELSLTAKLEMHWWFLNGTLGDSTKGQELVVALDDDLVVTHSGMQNIGNLK